MDPFTRTVETRAANRDETRFFISVLHNSGYTVDSDIWTEIGRDMGFGALAGHTACEECKEMMEELKVPLAEPIGEGSLEDCTIEQLGVMLIEKEDDVCRFEGKLRRMRDEVKAVKEELEVKKAMKVDEDRLKAEREFLDKQEREMRQKVRERLRNKKRKTDDVSAPDAVDV